MNNIEVKNSDLIIPELAIGCMRISKVSEKRVTELVDTAMQNEINFFELDKKLSSPSAD